MPELPDVAVYVEALNRILRGHVLERIRVESVFVLRSVSPSLLTFEGKRLLGARRLGKRVVLELEEELYLVIHLMIAGRLRWRPTGSPPKRRPLLPKRFGLVAFDFDAGTLLLTEAGSKKRASLHAVQGASGLAEHDRGGLEVLEAGLPQFRERLEAERHTLKRALTDPSVFSGIGNAYSDEILHRARLSPFRMSTQLDPDELERLYHATRTVLGEWVQRLREEVGDGFPKEVTAFREGMAVHGRYGLPCPACGSPIQRIVYASNEANYCAACQNAGRLLADRALSRLLKKDWPRTLDELEQRRSERIRSAARDHDSSRS